MVFEAPKLIGLDDFINAVGITGIFIVYMIPSIIIVLTIYSLYRHFKNKKRKKIEKSTESKKDAISSQTKTSNVNIDIKDTSKDINEEPKDKTKYRDLNLEFDETGRVK